MKFYFVIIILVFVLVIFLLFFVLYKIYRLHTNAIDELEVYEQEELLSNTPSSKASSDDRAESVDSKESFLSNDTDGLDFVDAVPSKQNLLAAQPSLKDLVGPAVPSLEQSPTRQGSSKEKPHVKLSLQYDRSKYVMKVVIKHISWKVKSRNGSSESYVDVQVSAYRFRTYRNPGYRRPARAIIKRPVEIQMGLAELKSHFLLVFLLRYDPFSRLKVDGEVAVKLSDVLSEGFLDGCQVEVSRALVKSKQDFTAFVLRSS